MLVSHSLTTISVCPIIHHSVQDRGRSPSSAGGHMVFASEPLGSGYHHSHTTQHRPLIHSHTRDATHDCLLQQATSEYSPLFPHYCPPARPSFQHSLTSHRTLDATISYANAISGRNFKLPGLACCLVAKRPTASLSTAWDLASRRYSLAHPL